VYDGVLNAYLKRELKNYDLFRFFENHPQGGNINQIRIKHELH